MDNKDNPKSMTPKKNVDIELRLEETAICIVGEFTTENIERLRSELYLTVVPAVVNLVYSI